MLAVAAVFSSQACGAQGPAAGYLAQRVVFEQPWLVLLIGKRRGEMCIMEDWPTLSRFEPNTVHVVGDGQTIGLGIKSDGCCGFAQLILGFREPLTDFSFRRSLQCFLYGCKDLRIVQECGVCTVGVFFCGWPVVDIEDAGVWASPVPHLGIIGIGGRECPREIL